MSDAPKAPKRAAPKEEHQRFARELLASDHYREEPKGGFKPSEVPPREDKKYKPKDEE